MIRAALVLWLAFATGAAALTLEFPANATLTAEESRVFDSTPVATGPFADGALPRVRPEGAVTLQSWRVDAGGLTSLQLLAPLRAQLEGAGFEITYACRTEVCGGFDFRFVIEVLPPPAMQVTLGDFRYLAARRETEAGAEIVALLVSRTSRAGFVQVTRIGPAEGGTVDITAGGGAVRSAAAPAGDFGAEIEGRGRVVLTDLTFDTGSARLGQGEFASLRALAAYLDATPGRTVALVGHTDSEGALDANIALSRRRAASVLERLVTDYGADRGRLEAEGMGYLSPVASNLTPEGREANRRVEAILTSTR